jgi:hypothetical protein
MARKILMGAAVAVVLMACGDHGHPPPPPAPVAPAPAPGPAAAAQAAAEVPPAEPEVTWLEQHVMGTHNGTISDCMSSRMRLTAEEMAAPDLEDVRAGFLNPEFANAEGATLLRVPCSTQLADRTPWATCEWGGEGFESTLYIYDFGRVYRADRAMVACLGRENGRWNALPRNTLEWQSAQVEYDLAQLERRRNRRRR